MPDGRKQLVVFTSARTGTKPTQTFISTTKAMGIDQFYQRYRIVVQKKAGPTGDPYFAYDYQYVGEIEDMADAKVMRSLYDQYGKSGFIVDTGAEDDGDTASASFKPRREAETGAFIDDDKDPIPF